MANSSPRLVARDFRQQARTPIDFATFDLVELEGESLVSQPSVVYVAGDSRAPEHRGHGLIVRTASDLR